MTDTAISVEHVTYRYRNGFQALNDVSFSIQKNEFVAIIGQNGAGKSTLLKNLVGLYKPTQGNIVVDGVNTRDISVARLSTKIGFVLQNPDRQLFADTVEEEITFGPRNLKLDQAEIDRRLERALEMTGLGPLRKEFPMALSAGDRAKVVIASVIAMDPEIIILDEPTTGQDRRGCAQIMEIARDFQQRGFTVVVVTHHMALVTEYAQRVIVMCKGRQLLDGPTAEVFAQAERLREAFVMPPQVTQLAAQLYPQLKQQQAVLRTQELAGMIAQSVSPDIRGKECELRR